MSTKQRYELCKAPAWANPATDAELIELTRETAVARAVRESGKGYCYRYAETFKTSNESNERSSINIWHLSDADLLQGASVHQFTVRESESIQFHRLAVIRNGTLIEKKDEATIRVLDDEENSGQGTIHKTKKVHCLIDDVRLNDIFVLEFTSVTVFDEAYSLDRLYADYRKSFSAGYWQYATYCLRVINKRAEPLEVRKQYFATAEENGAVEIVASDQEFVFLKENFLLPNIPDAFNPCIEIMTQATWKQISSELASWYSQLLLNPDFTAKDLSALLRRASDEPIDATIRAIIEYVQDEIVYLYDAETMHSHVPQPISETLERKSGDCKAKSLLLVKLLQALGVESEIILVNYRFDPFISRSTPSPFLFNHAIVKIRSQDKDFFIDPTWRNRRGLLEYRAQPFFEHYLPIRPNSELQTKPARAQTDFNLEDVIEVELKKGKAKLVVNTIYRTEDADSMRDSLKRNTHEELIKNQNTYLLTALDAPAETEMSDYFSDETFEIIGDDPERNQLTTRLRVTIPKPYKQPTRPVFKYYYKLNAERIRKFKHRDHLCDAFIAFPQKYTLRITSDLCIQRDRVTMKECARENAYFSFSQRKKLGLRTLEVTSEYTPKLCGEIKTEDLEEVRKDYAKLADSNFGTGVILISFLRWIRAGENKLPFYAFWVIALYSWFIITGQISLRNGEIVTNSDSSYGQSTSP